jgi:pimeloyl-ACP methyl ester carboxylesterase
MSRVAPATTSVLAPRSSPLADRRSAADLAALIIAACSPPVFLVGLSMGSLIAVQIAHDRPELVRSAVVMGTCVRKTGHRPERVNDCLRSILAGESERTHPWPLANGCG